MSKIYEIRRDNMRALIRERSASSVAKACGYSGPSYVSQMAGKKPTRPITEDNARKFERGLGLPDYWLDVERDSLGAPVVKPTAALAPAEKLPPPVFDGEPAPKLTMIDPERFSECAALVAEGMKRNGPKMSAEKFTNIVSMAYDSDYIGNDLRDFVNKLVRLAG